MMLSAQGPQKRHDQPASYQEGHQERKRNTSPGQDIFAVYHRQIDPKTTEAHKGG